MKVLSRRLGGAIFAGLVGVVAYRWWPLAGQLGIGLGAIMGAFGLGLGQELPHRDGPAVWLRMTCAIAAFVFGVMQLGGVAAGGTDPLAPMLGLLSAR